MSKQSMKGRGRPKNIRKTNNDNDCRRGTKMPILPIRLRLKQELPSLSCTNSSSSSVGPRSSQSNDDSDNNIDVDTTEVTTEETQTPPSLCKQSPSLVYAPAPPAIDCVTITPGKNKKSKWLEKKLTIKRAKGPGSLVGAPPRLSVVLGKANSSPNFKFKEMSHSSAAKKAPIPRQPASRFVCDFCPRKFFARHALRQHLNDVHSYEMEQRQQFLAKVKAAEAQRRREGGSFENAENSSSSDDEVNEDAVVVVDDDRAIITKVKPAKPKRRRRVQSRRKSVLVRPVQSRSRPQLASILPGEDGRYTCDICNNSYTFLSSLQRHVKLAHMTQSGQVDFESKPDEIHRCTICDITFCKERALRGHINSRHRLRSAGQVPFRQEHSCSHCAAKFYTKHALFQHYRLCGHRPIQSPNGKCVVGFIAWAFLAFPQRAPKTLVNRSTNVFKPLAGRCLLCNFGYKLPSSYLRHCNAQHASNPPPDLFDVVKCGRKPMIEEIMDDVRLGAVQKIDLHSSPSFGSSAVELLIDVEDKNDRDYKPVQLEKPTQRSTGWYPCPFCDRTYLYSRSRLRHIQVRHSENHINEAALAEHDNQQRVLVQSVETTGSDMIDADVRRLVEDLVDDVVFTEHLEQYEAKRQKKGKASASAAVGKGCVIDYEVIDSVCLQGLYDLENIAEKLEPDDPLDPTYTPLSPKKKKPMKSLLRPLRWECKHCTMKFGTRAKLSQHVRDDHRNGNEGMYPCGECPETFKHLIKLVRHERKAHPRSVIGSGAMMKEGEEPPENLKHVCQMCGRAFAYFSALNKHIDSHVGNRRVRCRICGITFAQRSSLRIHRRLHSGARPYKCPKCPKDFVSSSALVVHDRVVHQLLKPFSCPEPTCDRMFGTKSSMKQHALTHTGEKPFPCSICGRQFPLRTHLNTHSRTWHPGQMQYTCVVNGCGLGFITFTEINRHCRMDHQMNYVAPESARLGSR